MESPTVLVVDDEPLIRLHIACILEEAGCTSIQAANAEEAISAVNSEISLKAVISDIRMPGKLDGIGLSHYVSERRPELKIILSSANTPAQNDIPPGVAFMPKPVDHLRLTSLAQELCR